VGLSERVAPVVRDCRCRSPLPALLVGVSSTEEGVVGAVEVARRGLGEGQRMVGGGGEALIAGEKLRCFACAGERFVAEAEPSERLCLFGAHRAQLLGVTRLFEQPFRSAEVAKRLLPLVLEATQLAAEAVAVGEPVGVVERFEQGERAPGVGECQLWRSGRPGPLGEGAAVEDAQARGGELVRERCRLLDQRARPLRVAACVEGEGELGAVAGLQERVGGGGCEAALEQGDPLGARSGGEVAVGEGLVDFGSLAGADARGGGGFELLDRLLVLATRGGVEAEGGARPRAAPVARLRRGEPAQGLLGFVVAAEAQLELGRGELVLAFELERDLPPRLQVGGT
jgi:hypothetical protein